MGIFSFLKKNKNSSDSFEIVDKKEIIFDDISLKVLSKNQQKLKQALEHFSTIGFLGGGTAIALQLGHRKSIDFDFFTYNSVFSYFDFEQIIKSYSLEIDKESRERYRGIESEIQDEIHVNILGVKFSLSNFYRTLYDDQVVKITGNTYILNGLKTATIEELACMKLYAMMTRSKWKDAVDLYFILNQKIDTLDNLFLKSEKYFFNIFRTDLVLENLLAGDWDKTEKVEYIINNPPTDEQIIDFLKKEAFNVLDKREK